MPNVYASMMRLLDKLPYYDALPCLPFGGFALNSGVCTLGHRDRKDTDSCLVIPFGEWRGAKLVLYEPGLVFDLNPNQVLVFRSGQITHFNTHLDGVRSSLVFHTDADLDIFAQHNNHNDSVMSCS